MDITQKIQSASHSGASLKVLQDSGDYFVQKNIFSAIEKNFAAINKQISFESILTPSYKISAIPVISIDRCDDKLTIIMPYVEGLGGEQVAYKGSKTVAKNLKLALDFYLINNLARSEEGVYPISIVLEKIESINSNLHEKWHLFPNLQTKIEQFKTYCQKDLKMPIGECHGDLTLSNIKITENNELVLFDFLSCDFNSTIQDAAKIVQDFEYGWSFRKEKESIKLKGEVFCQHSYPSFLNTLNRLYHYEMRVVEILTILRIAPYIKESDEITINWFNNIISKAMSKIKG